MGPTAWWPNIMQQTTIRFSRSSSSPTWRRHGRGGGDSSPHTIEMLGELLGYVEVARSVLLLAEERPRLGRGRVVPRRPGHASDAGHAGHVVPACSTSSSRSATTCWPRPAGPCSTTPAFVRSSMNSSTAPTAWAPGPGRAVSPGVGLHRLEPRGSQRPVRKQLLGFGQDEPHARASGLRRPHPCLRARRRHAGRRARLSGCPVCRHPRTGRPSPAPRSSR